MLGHPIAASESAGVRQPRPPQSYEAGESSVGMPYDPNLTCTYCGERFRVGEIQSFRRHVLLYYYFNGYNSTTIIHVEFGLLFVVVAFAICALYVHVAICIYM